MQLIIELNDIKDNGQREWLIRTLKLIGIKYKTGEQPPSLEEYNADLKTGRKEVQRRITTEPRYPLFYTKITPHRNAG